eukprot:CAMPEP_0113938544 /NCGR_PEP_ID=MMETSP1339-20121228/4975_1 /TAXON_ID=94617 /ORGANISM="Fibrocapsa japonica" /LENGTH=236 /DNA_ID=CAMNT_0000941713 /DNA_START=120 /DNA_END=830 /DNA_ORIENTATION=+ /assembly_acc=CAM_ASM_000762
MSPMQEVSGFQQHSSVMKMNINVDTDASRRSFLQKSTSAEMNINFDTDASRRSFIQKSTSVVLSSAALLISPQASNAAQSNGIELNTSESGFKWADPRVGTGQPLKSGQYASIDYSIASTAGRFPQIYTTKDKGVPYRWKLGDGSTIQGIELAILGTDDVPPMLPGGIRRVIIPASLGYEKLMTNAKCIDGEEGSIGPIPPKEDFGGYQRWYSFYCNPRIPYQPDLVVDIKLYGKR